jgi:hypothetical protein
MLALWFRGRSSPAVRARLQTHNEMAAKLFVRALKDARLVVDEIPRHAIPMSIEVLDRMLEMAFRDKPSGDEAILKDAAYFVAGGRFPYATQEGIDGIPRDEFIARLEEKSSPMLKTYRYLESHGRAQRLS